VTVLHQDIGGGRCVRTSVTFASCRCVIRGSVVADVGDARCGAGVPDEDLAVEVGDGDLVAGAGWLGLGAERRDRPARRIRRPLRDRETGTRINQLVLRRRRSRPARGVTGPARSVTANTQEPSPMSRYRTVTDVLRHHSDPAIRI